MDMWNLYNHQREQNSSGSNVEQSQRDSEKMSFDERVRLMRFREDVIRALKENVVEDLSIIYEGYADMADGKKNAVDLFGKELFSIM
jgi:hypothetical protein